MICNRPFQSQLGSIGAAPTPATALHLPAFQSQLGSIGASLEPEKGCLWLSHFQSQLGSIGAQAKNCKERGCDSFQSQLGSIGALPTSAVGKVFRFAFNPSLVRLAPGSTTPSKGL